MSFYLSPESEVEYDAVILPVVALRCWIRNDRDGAVRPFFYIQGARKIAQKGSGFLRQMHGQ